jgi:anti-sigma factor RsiW
MTKRCLDEGLLQAYIDGELAPERAAEAAAHIAACAACAASLAEAEAESSFFATAFAADDSLAVPTEVLRSRINAAVARLEPATEPFQSKGEGRGFGGFLTSLTGLLAFTPRRAAAFASLLAAVAAGVVYFAVVRPQGAPRRADEIAASAPTPAPGSGVRTPESGGGGNVAPVENKGNLVAGNEKGNGKATAVNASYSKRRAASRGAATDVKPTPATAGVREQLLPGEKDYKAAIASLEQTIKMGGDVALKPALRVEYERNIAILDNAIAQTRQVAATNPKDRDAVGFLMSAYQSKVELLTKVADQAQVATLGR